MPITTAQPEVQSADMWYMEMSADTDSPSIHPQAACVLSTVVIPLHLKGRKGRILYIRVVGPFDR